MTSGTPSFDLLSPPEMAEKAVGIGIQKAR